MGVIPWMCLCVVQLGLAWYPNWNRCNQQSRSREKHYCKLIPEVENYVHHMTDHNALRLWKTINLLMVLGLWYPKLLVLKGLSICFTIMLRNWLLILSNSTSLTGLKVILAWVLEGLLNWSGQCYGMLLTTRCVLPSALSVQLESKVSISIFQWLHGYQRQGWSKVW